MPQPLEPGSEYEGNEPQPKAYPQESYPAEYAPESTYDPGAALVDENQYYGATEEPHYDSNQVPAEGVHQEYPAAENSYPTYEAPEGRGVYDEAPASSLPAPPPVRSAAPKKKTARAPQRRPAVSKTPTASRRPVKKPVYNEGISAMTVFLTLIALGMLAGVAMALLPKEMSTVAGYQVDPIA